MSDALPHNEALGQGGSGEQRSFRDPAGFVLCSKSRVLRFVRAQHAEELFAFLRLPSVQAEMEHGRLVRTSALDAAGSTVAVEDFAQKSADASAVVTLEHERIPFPSYPYEWPPEMLFAAAGLTLDFAERFLSKGFGLKDATPYNLLFRGTDPVFVDLLSFERRSPADPTWLPCAQFIRTFLLPLALSRHYGIRLDQLLLTRRDGIEPTEVYNLLDLRRKLSRPFITLVTFPKWLNSAADGGGSGLYQQSLLKDEEKAQYILESLLKRLRRTLHRLAPDRHKTSAWSGYMRGGNSYTSTELAGKCDFVAAALNEYAPKRVLDVGCNAGHFSLIAARAGASVVAIDQDPVVVGETWRAAKADGASVLPLVVDLCRPSPATGWLNQECLSFLDRARGYFDAVMMLAVVHHMLVTERIPLDNIVDLAAELTSNLLVIEYVGPDDPMFRRLLRGRDELHRDLTVSQFEAAYRRRFEIVRKQAIVGSTRWLYVMRKLDDRPA